MTSSVHQPSTGHTQSSGALARAQRDNHHLPFRKGVATPGQVAAIERALGILLRSLENSHPDDEMVRAGLTVRLMVDLGRNAEQLSQLWRMHLNANDHTLPTAWGLVSWISEGATKYGWWLPAGVHLDAKRKDRSEKARGTVWLPVLERSEHWLAIAGWTQNPELRPLLAETPQNVKRDVSAFLAWAKATLGPLSNALPSADRLPSIVTEQLAWHPTGDRTLAKQLAGQDMEHSTARGYYTSLSTPKAAKQYAKAMPSPVSDLSLVTQADGRDEIAMPAFAQSALTREKPKGSPEVMRAALELLGKKPDQRQKGRDLIQSHNDFVKRLWIALALSTAARGVTDWVPGLQRIEPRTGGLIVLDKDREENDPPDTKGGKALGSMLGRARLVFLHPMVREMLRFYIDHLRKLSGRAGVDASSKALIEEHVKGLEADELRPFLILGAKAKGIVAKVVEPAWFKDEQKGLADVPANFARHTLRSGLLGHVPQSAIDAYLGHFDRGTEPWSNGSALDPSAYRALLSVIFEAHFEEAAMFNQKPGRVKEQGHHGEAG